MSETLPVLISVFLVVLLGLVLRRLKLVDDTAWSGMETSSYYVFFPALLIHTLMRADFANFALTGAAGAFMVAISLMLALAWLLQKPVQAALGLSGPAYSSFYQAVTRWNAFIVLSVAEKLHGEAGAAMVAIGIGAMIVPINIVNVAAVAQMTGNAGGGYLKRIVTNPLIISVLAGIALNASGLRLPEPAALALEMIARLSLPLGLILVGAGLVLVMPRNAWAAIGLATFAKLLLAPAIFAACAWAFGLRGPELAMFTLCACGPTAMNGYLVARAMGGDAPLFAAMTTAQTAFCFVTLPLVLAALTLLG